MQYATLDDFIADFARAAEAARERLRGHDARFCLQTKQGRTFYILIEDGEVSLPATCAGPFDGTVTADEAFLVDLLNGKSNPVTALLTRRVTVKGNIGKLLELATLAR